MVKEMQINKYSTNMPGGEKVDNLVHFISMIFGSIIPHLAIQGEGSAAC
jgi:hypothetical protein